MTHKAAVMGSWPPITKRWLRPFQIELQKPLTVQGITSHHRAGLFLYVEDREGHVGCGEISPLPGLSRESLDEARDQLHALCQGTMGEADQDRLHPSVAFGVTMAHMNLWAAQKGQPWSTLAATNTTTPAASSVPLQGLLWGPREQILAQVSTQQEQGYRHFKWKVARHSVDEEIEIYKAICDRLQPGVRLRLDANRGWSMEEAMAFVKAVDLIHIEFIEEPLKTPAALTSFVAETRCPVAVDESLSEAHPDEMWEVASALVLKPQSLGIDTTLAWIDRAKRLPTPCHCVISSTFETGLGLAFLAQLSALVAPGETAGLDTQRWLLRAPSESLEGGMLLKDEGKPKDIPQQKDPYGVLAQRGAIEIQRAHDLSLSMVARSQTGDIKSDEY